MRRSTPAAAMRGERYLFQSWVRASEGGVAGAGPPVGREGDWWRGMEAVRWFEAEEGVRRS